MSGRVRESTGAHSPGLGKRAVDKEVDGAVGAEGESLSQDPHELRDRDFEGNQELVLLEVHEGGTRRALHHHWDPVWVLLQDVPRLLLPLLYSRGDGGWRRV